MRTRGGYTFLAPLLTLVALVISHKFAVFSRRSTLTFMLIRLNAYCITFITIYKAGQVTGACYDFFLSLDYSKKPQGRNLKCQIFIQHFFKIVLYWCLYLTYHNIGTHLKLNKYIFDISIPFCHHLYLSATLKQCFTEFAVYRITFHHDDRSVPGRIPTCDLIGRLFLGSGLQRMC